MVTSNTILPGSFNVLEVDSNTLLGRTLTGAQKVILGQKLRNALSELSADKRKARLCAEIAKVLVEFSF